MAPPALHPVNCRPVSRTKPVPREGNLRATRQGTFGARRSDLGRWPGWRPSFLPRALTAARPDFTRSLSRSRSNCAIPASIVAIIRPCGVSSSNVIPLTGCLREGAKYYVKRFAGPNGCLKSDPLPQTPVHAAVGAVYQRWTATISCPGVPSGRAHLTNLAAGDTSVGSTP